MRALCKLTALTLALAAMLLRALLPAGWMPNPGGASVSPFAICTIDGLRHILPDGGKKAPERDHASAPCAFAAATPFPAPASTPLPARSAAGIYFVLAQVLHEPTALQFRRAHGARAPPSLA